MLVKFIDAESDLSIQVHPNNEQASERHGSMGKTEMWYVVDAKPGTYLYAGFAKSITPEEYCRKVEDGTICEVLAKHNISAGDAFFIPAGRVHAICGGALIAEVQQSSDITYRIYDYGRMGMDGKPRELHTELAKDVMDYAVHKEYSVNYAKDENQSNLICECEYFTVNKMKLTEAKQRNLKHLESFLIYICIGGECKIGDSLVLKYGQTCLIPASCADVTITPLGNDGTVELMEVYVNKV
jgi:mannose-6-phosphate isomerase